MPLIGESLAYVLALHLREQIRHDAFDLAELSSGRAAARRRGHRLLRRHGRLHPARRDARPGGARHGHRPAGRAAASEVVEPPVRLVKLIGDAAMLVGPEARPVLDAALAAGRARPRARARSSRCCAPGSPAGMALPRARRLVRAAGQPREPDHGDRPAGQRARRPRRSTSALADEAYGGRSPGRASSRASTAP